MYSTIRTYYERGLYTDEQVKVFVQANWITTEQFKEITGLDYIVSQ